MEFMTLKASERSPGKKRAARALRSAGTVPAIVYGKEMAPRPITVDAKYFTNVMSSGSRLFKLEMDREIEQALLVDVQWDLYGLNVIHADFSRVSDTDKLQINVPIRLIHANQIDLQGNYLSVVMHVVQVEASIATMPREIVLDIADLTMDKPKTAADLPLPEGVTLVGHAADVVVHIVAPRAEPVAAAEVAEPVEGAPAEGAAAEEGKDKKDKKESGD